MQFILQISGHPKLQWIAISIEYLIPEEDILAEYLK